MERKALEQLIGTILVVALVATVVLSHESQPRNTGQLKVIISELRSSASECALLSTAAPTDARTQAYRRVHFEMMASSLEQALKTLESARVQSGLEGMRDSSSQAGRALLDELSAWGSASRSPSRRPAFQGIAARLLALEQQLE